MHLMLIAILLLMFLQFRGVRAVFIGWLVIFAVLAH
jgi:hypothetical protein